MSMLKLLKATWRAVVPNRIRSSNVVGVFKSRYFPHNWIYDKEYYMTDVDGAAVRSAPAMVHGLVKAFSPNRVVDVGCGTGALAAQMKKQGIDVCGLEYADSAIEICRDRGLEVRKFDIETSGSAPADLLGADLVVSFEVAEHLPETIADKYVSLLTSMTDTVVISVAPPGQGGTDHVNEQPEEYWIEKFRENNFEIDRKLTAEIRTAFRASGSVASFYRENTLVFVRS